LAGSSIVVPNSVFGMKGSMIAEKFDKLTGVAIGDTVVYAAHGIGRVVARGQQRIGGAERVCVILDLAAGLRVTLPLAGGAERLRPVVGKRELEAVRTTLASTSSARDGAWTRRVEKMKAKLAGGRASDLAEIVRDGRCFERSGVGKRLSAAESQIYRRARSLLIEEVSSAQGVCEDEAEAWIDEQIALPDRSEA